MRKLCVALTLVVMVSGCSLLSKLGLKSEDAVVASDLVMCVQKAVDAVKDQDLSHEEKVDVASRAAAECAKPVVSRVLDK